MEPDRLDHLARSLVAAGSRRSLLGRLAALPALGALLASLSPEEAGAKDRRRRRKARHRKRKDRGNRKRGCKPQSKTKVCAGTCGPVSSRETCGKTVDCGACDCDPPCGECFACQSEAGAPGSCLPLPQGTPCGPAPTCDGDTILPQSACDGSGVCEAAAPISCAPDLCHGAECVCGDVCASGCQFSSVQAAVDAASPGATILICAGTYLGSVAVNKDLTLVGAGDGADPASNTILDAQGNSRVLTTSGESTVTLQGLRLTGGDAVDGGGVYNGSDLTMTDCTVTGNTATRYGVGIYSGGDRLTMTGCAVTSNFGAGHGGGIYSVSPLVTMTDCEVSGNETTRNAGGIQLEEGRALLTGCTIARNWAGGAIGGILNWAGSLILEDSHVTGNSGNGVGGVYVLTSSDGRITVLGDTSICLNTLPQCGGFTNSACQDACP